LCELPLTALQNFIETPALRQSGVHQLKAARQPGFADRL
jgi:hypothetical protein